MSATIYFELKPEEGGLVGVGYASSTLARVLCGTVTTDCMRHLADVSCRWTRHLLNPPSLPDPHSGFSYRKFISVHRHNT